MAQSINYTLQDVRQKLASDPRWTEKAIIRLFEFQTAEEQSSEDTKELNSVGFNGFDARTLSYYAKWIQSGKHLSGKYLQKAQKMVPKYAGQILSLIQKKQ